MMKNKISKRHIGAAGELLVQYKLVKEEIDSARLTTDAGVDLVAYSPNGSKAYTIQIKTKEQQGQAPHKINIGKPVLNAMFNVMQLCLTRRCSQPLTAADSSLICYSQIFFLDSLYGGIFSVLARINIRDYSDH